MTISVVIADDQALVRSGFSMLLTGEPGIDVVGEAGNGAEAVALAASARPDVILMDVRMPVMDGLEATRRITADAGLSGTRVVVLTTFETDETVFEALRAGASGFLLKDVRPVELLDAVRLVAAGEALLSPGATRRLIEAYVRVPAVGAASSGAVAVLTDREREVLGLVATGMSNGEIAERLVVSGATVKTHMSHLLRKLGARDRAQLVVIAYRAGVVSTTG